jgi:predicted DNA-binding transcriptional regulator AlpA
MATTLSFQQLCELFGYTPKNRRLTSAEAAEVLGIKTSTLEVKRSEGTGPRFFKLPGSNRVYYTERDVLEFIASGARTSTSQRAPLTAATA